jgi:hypothetical protein
MAEEHTPNRFRISWDGGAYYVSIPNYCGGWVVPASIADDLVKALEEIIKRDSRVSDGGMGYDLGPCAIIAKRTLTAVKQVGKP